MPNRTGKLTAEETEYYEFKALAGLINNSGFSAANEIISESDFHKEEYGFVFLSVRELDNIGKPYNNIDVLTDYLIKAGRIKDRDGFGHLINQIITSPASTDKLEEYCKEVKAGSLFRQRESAAKDGNYDLIVELTEELNGLDDNNKPEVLPLIPEPAVNTNKFPIHALGETIAPMIHGIQKVTQFDPSLIAHAYLSSVIATTQGIGTGEIRTLFGPMSLSIFFLLIGESSEGKGAIEGLAFKALKQVEREWREDFFDEIRIYKKEIAVFEAKQKKALAKAVSHEPVDEKIKFDYSTEANDDEEPPRPLDRRLTCDSPTLQKIKKFYFEGASIIALLAEDGQAFLGNWSMTAEKLTATIAELCKLGDSGSGSKEIASESDMWFYDRSFMMSLGLQPYFWDKMLEDKVTLKQGLMSRMAVCYPPSSIGKRPEKDANTNEKAEVFSYTSKFDNRVKVLLNFMFQNCINNKGELIRINHRLTKKGQAIWVGFQNEYNAKLDANHGEYGEQREMLGKMEVMPMKIATALYIFEQLNCGDYPNFNEPKIIPDQYISRGIEITKYYWHETKWLFQKHEVDVELKDIEKFSNWLHSKADDLSEDGVFSLSKIVQYASPRRFRNRERALAGLKSLEQHGYGEISEPRKNQIRFKLFKLTQQELFE